MVKPTSRIANQRIFQIDHSSVFGTDHQRDFQRNITAGTRNVNNFMVNNIAFSSTKSSSQLRGFYSFPQRNIKEVSMEASDCATTVGPLKGLFLQLHLVHNNNFKEYKSSIKQSSRHQTDAANN